MLEADVTGEGRTGAGAIGGAAAGGEAPAPSHALPREHGDDGDPTASSDSSAAAASVGSPKAAAAAAAGAPASGAALPAISYPGIQTDPAEVLLNGVTMRASFAPPTVRLATFHK